MEKSNEHGFQEKVSLSESDWLIIDVLAEINKAAELSQSESLISGEKVHSLIVGGWSRDKLLGKMVNDMDIVVSHGSTGIFKKLFPAMMRKKSTAELQVDAKAVKELILQSGACAGRTLVMLEAEIVKTDGLKAGLTSESEKISIDIREVGPNETIKEDVLTRDFTVNAIYLDPVGRKFRHFKDVCDGIEDLRHGILKPVESTLRTFTDIRRYIRAIRISISRKLTLDPDLSKYIEVHGPIAIVCSLHGSDRPGRSTSWLRST